MAGCLGRVLVGGKDYGAGFALGPKLVITANHVIRDRNDKPVVYVPAGGEAVGVERVQYDAAHDAAILRLVNKVEFLPTSAPVRGAGWRIESPPPGGNDPQLHGTVTAPRMTIKNAQDQPVEVVQLQVDEQLGDFAGYSGSAVLDAEGRAVVAVLVEQKPLRTPLVLGERRAASNVLYAVPISDVVTANGLSVRDVSQTRPEPSRDEDSQLEDAPVSSEREEGGVRPGARGQVYRAENFRDYLYVSARKVVRMSRTLGLAGGGLKLDMNSRPEDVIALVPEVERAIDEQFGIKYVTDPELQAGHWFLIDGIPMTYGIPGLDGYGVLFVGEAGNRFILGGSAEYLLDRPVHRSGRWGYSASTLGGLRDLLETISIHERADDDSEWADSESARYSLNRASAQDYHFDSVRQEFGVSEEPLTALARCLDINHQDNDTTVVGTPLYVASYVP